MAIFCVRWEGKGVWLFRWLVGGIGLGMGVCRHGNGVCLFIPGVFVVRG